MAGTPVYLLYLLATVSIVAVSIVAVSMEHVYLLYLLGATDAGGRGISDARDVILPLRAWCAV
eukprot:scaffold114224_cov54-Phaeocystis_antarctica.AAC.1